MAQCGSPGGSDACLVLHQQEASSCGYLAQLAGKATGSFLSILLNIRIDIFFCFFCFFHSKSVQLRLASNNLTFQEIHCHFQNAITKRLVLHKECYQILEICTQKNSLTDGPHQVVIEITDCFKMKVLRRIQLRIKSLCSSVSKLTSLADN